VTSPAAGVAANSAIGGLLMLARAFPRRLIAQRAHRWEQYRRELAPADLEGQTVLIIGVGTVGAAVARFAQALAMQVIGVRRSPEIAVDGVAEMHAVAKLDALLPRAQWLVLACPHSAETDQLLDARRLGLLPRGAGVVNAAHAGLIDDAALAAALVDGQIGAAYLDFGPLATDSPLRGQPNLLLASPAAA
jgi:phosphoglycerate dehydrogenase-like enzyme